ncbi:hypothetical protein ACCS91_06250 [Rhizobium ruizarguesonis]|uniref:hypothetical protein n=1 Tax=Rhizobium ruizarguesonis TaxID=2081791 RepID=UPI00102FB64A|nr:hypothetical protein [Rhizobium ruizarguesonis]QIJ44388.1 hypothetical protein G7039_30105 [Rhizobium leguminosarum]TAW68146.1 hypothetical protein ELI10_31760 [Rhizobium ruizarguesonis]TAX04138.1 hypothetical protein ELI09_32435 [Rhizobium ruizarguesonis]TAX07117.1 hypothetical protein ELI08_31755 [Rhizobium ruizarguesonis]
MEADVADPRGGIPSLASPMNRSEDRLAARPRQTTPLIDQIIDGASPAGSIGRASIDDMARCAESMSDQTVAGRSSFSRIRSGRCGFPIAKMPEPELYF